MKENRNEIFWEDCSHFLNKVLESVFLNHQYDHAEARDMLLADNLINHLEEEQGELEVYGSTDITSISLQLGIRFFNEVILHHIIFFLMPFYPLSVRCDRPILIPANLIVRATQQSQEEFA